MSQTDHSLRAQVDAQLLEQGAFTPLELLLDSGRLDQADYERWRMREIELLEEVLMGDPDKIRAQLETAVGYARSIGLVEQPQELYAWHTEGARANERPLRISADRQLDRLIGSRYVSAQTAPQMDLFVDNPVVALTNGIVRSLCSRNLGETQRQLDRLYALAPTHADLAAFDQLVAALGHLNRAVGEPRGELDFLMAVTGPAKRLLGPQARDLLGPLWRQLALALSDHAFTPEQAELHRSYALVQAQDWAAAAGAVLNEPHWWQQPALCQRLAQSAFHRQNRPEALTAWFYLCWYAPVHAASVLDGRRQPDVSLGNLWQQFLDSDEEINSSTDTDSPLTASEFPAWLLLHEPGLARQLSEELPKSQTPGEMLYQCVHRWLQARRENRSQDEIALRKSLQSLCPGLFRHLKRIV